MSTPRIRSKLSAEQKAANQASRKLRRDAAAATPKIADLTAAPSAFDTPLDFSFRALPAITRMRVSIHFNDYEYAFLVLSNTKLSHLIDLIGCKQRLHLFIDTAFTTQLAIQDVTCSETASLFTCMYDDGVMHLHADV